MGPAAALVAVVAIIGLLLSGCSSGFSKDEAIEAFMSANPDASTAEATCVIDDLIETYEDGPVEESALDGLEAELLTDPPDPEFVLDQYRAKFGCGMTEDVEAQLRRELAENDISTEAVGCVAEELAGSLTDDDLDVLINDEMTDSFYRTFFAAVETCDALP